jgi:hypothetical protein
VKRLLSQDPLTGIQTWFHKDGPGFKLEATQDVSAILDMNKALQNEGIAKGEGKEWWHAGQVPMIVLQQWAKDAGLNMNDPAFGAVIKRKLNDSDNRAFRTGLFRL